MNPSSPKIPRAGILSTVINDKNSKSKAFNEKLKNFLNHNLSIILYALIILMLLSLSIYNAYWVVYSYLYDNKITYVQLKTDSGDDNDGDVQNTDEKANGKIPFLQNLTISIHFEKSVFPETWSMSTHEISELSRSSNDKRVHKYHFNESSFYINQSINQHSELSLTGKFDLVDMSSMILLLDTYFLRWKEVRDTGASWESVDRFLISDYGDRLIDKLLFELLPHMHEQINEAQNPELSPNATGPFFLIDDLSTNFLTFSVPLADHLSKNLSRVTYGIAQDWPHDVIRSDGSWLHYHYLNQTLSLYARFSPLLKSYTDAGDVATLFIKTDYNSSWIFDIRITNAGVYQKNEDDEKDDDSAKCALCGDLVNVDDCVLKCRLLSVIQACQCLPFTYRRLFPNDRGRAPFCTSELYALCSNDSSSSRRKNLDQNDERCKSSNCIPCTVTNNNYATVATKVARDGVFRYRFFVACENTLYVLFREKNQNSWMEMLGQLGGNLGLFLSFSLLGVWQFLVFLVEFYFERRRAIAQKKNSQPVSSILNSWLDFARLTTGIHVSSSVNNNSSMNIVKNNYGNGVIDEINDKIEGLKDDIKNLKISMDTEIRNRMDEMKKDLMAQIEQKILSTVSNNKNNNNNKTKTP